MTGEDAGTQAREGPRCRNCGAPAPAPFCPECGQETKFELPTLREFMREAMGRLVAFDGRLWRTLSALAFRPGLLTRAYLDGRRRHYVRPARLFLAMSLILFAVIRFAVKTEDFSEAITLQSSESVMASGAPAAKEAAQAAAGRGFHVGFDDNYHLVISGSASAFLSEELRRRYERFNRLDQRQRSEQLQEGAVRYGSYVAFALLPLFAALQFATYAGQGGGPPGRPRVYAEHLVYSAHIHTFWFLIAMIALVAPWSWLRALLAAWGIYYVIRAKRDVYGGSWWGRAVRTLGVAVVYAIALVLATVGLVIVAALFE